MTAMATVRIHGSTDQNKLKEATLRFLKRAEQERRKVRNEARTEANKGTAEIASAKEA